MAACSPVHSASKHFDSTAKQCIPLVAPVRYQSFDDYANFVGWNCAVGVNEAKKFGSPIFQSAIPSGIDCSTFPEILFQKDRITDQLRILELEIGHNGSQGRIFGVTGAVVDDKNRNVERRFSEFPAKRIQKKRKSFALAKTRNRNYAMQIF
jgi:hypothetical protein